MKKAEKNQKLAFQYTTLLLFILSFFASAEQICELKLTTCPEDFSGDTLFVPPEIVALSSTIYACEPAEVIEGLTQTGAPPSIFFVIDHSYSMNGLGNTWPGNDVNGTRFNVTRDLIDTVYKLHPDAEIGLAVFREVLYFDSRDNDLFVQLEGQGNQSFMPLLQLDKNARGNTTGLQALKDILRTTTITRRNSMYNRNVTCVDLVYNPTFSTIGNTNINNAMDAALQAMKSAKNPPERQFIIFLSDGEPHPTDSTIAGYQDILRRHGGKDPFYFQNGTATPTTFTVYFSNDDTIPPASLTTMTANIKANGYSSSNSASDIWILKTDYEALMSLFMKKIITPIMSLTTGKATSMTINNVISTTLEDSGFIFSGKFPLDQNTTSFDIQIRYHLTNLEDNSQKDTLTDVQFHVVRKEGAELVDGLSSYCWDKATMSLYYNGKKVTRVDESMEKLEIRFDPGNHNYQSVAVDVTHIQGEKLDLEKYNLDKKDNFWTKTFVRRIDSAHPGDNILQHQMYDSIVVVYRNPEIPLDTIRVAVPFSVSNAIKVNSATYNDIDADGFIDSIFLAVDDNLDKTTIDLLESRIALPSFRNFVIDSIRPVPGGIVIRVREQSQTPRTYVTNNDVIQLQGGILPGGGMLEGGSVVVIDKVAPVINRAELVTSAAEKDSLRVYFSEPVENFESSRPFLFKTPKGDEYQVFLENGNLSGDYYLAAIRQIQSVSSISPQDSVWINTAASISDTSNNIQSNQFNRRVPLTIKQIPYKLIPEAVNNPFVPGNPIPAPVQEAYRSEGRLQELDLNNGGIIIVVKPETQLRPHVELAGKVSIFDVVKNTVIENEPMVFDKVSKKLFFVWNGVNHKKRKVATGTYLAVMEMSDNMGFKETGTIPVGIKR